MVLTTVGWRKSACQGISLGALRLAMLIMVKLLKVIGASFFSFDLLETPGRYYCLHTQEPWHQGILK